MIKLAQPTVSGQLVSRGQRDVALVYKTWYVLIIRVTWIVGLTREEKTKGVVDMQAYMVDQI